MDDERSDHRGTREAVNSVDLGNRGSFEDSSNSGHQNVSETVIGIRLEEEEGAVSASGGENEISNTNAKSNVGGSVLKDSKDDNQSHVIDVNSGGGDGNGKLGENLDGNLDGEKICRICHLSSDPSLETPPRTTTVTAMTPATTGLIPLGCGCKDELGIVHSQCAEAWFKLKGNRQCEICGETAKNVTGVGDNRLLVELNGMRSTGSTTNWSERRGGCLRGQPFCNFLMACLVIAFVLPWFFRVNMFD